MRSFDPTTVSEHSRASDLLLQTLSMPGSAEITVADLVAAFRDRAFGVVLLLAALPNCIPAPPGLGSIFGVPLLFFAVQMALGRSEPWLPAFLLRRKMRRIDLFKVALRAMPWLQRFERICRPRLTKLASPIAERLLGGFIALLAVSIIIPLPLTNFVPAVATAILSLALLEDDGLGVGLGVLVGIGGLLLTASGLLALTELGGLGIG